MRLIRKDKRLKREGYIYHKIYDIENIKTAILKASQGKREQRRVAKVLSNIDEYAHEIQDRLKSKRFKPSEPIVKIIQDNSSGKVRTIYKPNFYPDQIIHWSLMLQIEPILMKGMYQYSCGSIPKRGATYGQKAVRKWLDTDYRSTKYCLKMDVRKFYPSIDNNILKSMFRRKIKDADCLWLIDTIIDSNEGQPIGFYTSQWFANFFLEGLDHFIKEKLGVKYYVRYVDDLVILGSNKRRLHQVRKEIDAYLKGIKLQVKGNWQVFPIKSRDIDFLGLRFYRHRTTLRKRNALRIHRRARKIRKKGVLNNKDASAIISYWGWLKRTDSYNFYHDKIKSNVTINQARKVVSINAKIKIRNIKRGRVADSGHFIAKL